MSAKIIFVFCAQAFFIQTAFSQCARRAAIDASGFASPYNRAGSMAYDRTVSQGLPGWGGRGSACNGFAPSMEFTATSGGGLPVTSMSFMSPTGISVISDNIYEGALSVTGDLPFLSAVAMEGTLPTAGAGGINYGCGNGIVTMLSEGVGPAGFAPNAAFGTFGPNSAYGAGNSYGPGAFGAGNSFGPAAGFAPANKLGYGGCGRGMVY